jgi:hypothetical protein
MFNYIYALILVLLIVLVYYYATSGKKCKRCRHVKDCTCGNKESFHHTVDTEERPRLDLNQQWIRNLYDINRIYLYPDGTVFA